MCGLAFFVSKQDHSVQLKSAIEKLKHRGPDADGLNSMSIGELFLGMAHSRLAILDTSSQADQPFFSACKNYAIVYNGEIYNFKDLRDRLYEHGVHVSTTSDTEVLLKYYIHFGISSFKDLRGMFAFFVVDLVRRKTYAVRDYVGIKPLYICRTDSGFFGASEIRSLQCFFQKKFTVSKQDLFEFMNFGFVYEPQTGFIEVSKVPSGHFVEISLEDFSLVIERYSLIEDYSADRDFEKLLEKSISSQFVSDVPVGIFFSGGTDSSVIARYGNNNSLFFADYTSSQKTHEDSSYAREVSAVLECQLKTVRVGTNISSTDEALGMISFVASHTEEPISDFTFFSSFQLAKKARESGYVVMLSGMGGDEVFSGYKRYELVRYRSLLRMLYLPIYNLFGSGSLNFFNSSKFERLAEWCRLTDEVEAYARLVGYLSTEDLMAFFPDYKQRQAEVSDKINQLVAQATNLVDDSAWARVADMQGFLAHNLTVADKSTMLAGLELRVPLLSENLVALSLSVHGGRRLWRKKMLLKKSLRSVLPRNLVYRKKAGFNPSIYDLVAKLPEKVVYERLLIVDEYFSSDRAQKLCNNYYRSHKDVSYKVWQLLYLSYWLEHYAM